MKRWICMLLVSLMIFSIVGCGSNTENDIKETGQEKKATETKESVADDTDGRPKEGNMYLEGFPIVKEQITIKVAAVDWWNSENYATLKTPKEYEELTNIKVEWQHITSPEQLNLIFASGEELPDLFMFLDYDKVNELGKDGQLMAVQDLIKDYAPNIQAMIDTYPETKKICSASDGNMYIIPSMYMSPGEMLRGNTVINKHWLDNLGLEMPTNVDELYAVLKAFKEQDPNGNNKADEIPLTLEWDNDLNGISSLFGPWGVTSATFGPFFAKNQKEIVVSVMEPGYKEAIKYFHQLYAEGLLDQEAFTQDHDKYNSKISAEVVREPVVIGATNAYGPMNPGADEIGKWMYQSVPPLEGPYGKHHMIPIGGGLFTNSYMSADTKYPKEVIRWADGIADPERSFEWNGGPKDIFWEKTEEGKFRKFEQGERKDKNDKNTNYAFVLPIMGIHGEWYANNVLLDDASKLKLEILDNVKPYGDQFVVSKDRAGKLPLHFTKEQEDFIATHYIDIEQYCKNKEAQWIMQGGIDEEWDDFQAQLKKMKIQELKEIYQEGLDEWNK